MDVHVNGRRVRQMLLWRVLPIPPLLSRQRAFGGRGAQLFFLSWRGGDEAGQAITVD